MTIAWQGAQCPNRGPGLSHTRRGGQSDDPETWKCQECGVMLTDKPPSGVPDTATEAAVISDQPLPEMYAEIYDHKFSWTITGRCARCGSVELRHVDWLTGVDPGECAVDHRSIKPWTSCLICFQVVEPSMATGIPTGPKDRPGRGELTIRQQGRLNFHAYREREAAKKEGWDGP